MPRSLSFLLALSFMPCAAAADLGEFQQRAAEILEANRVPGAGIALVRNGEIIWAGGIGRADIDEDIPVLANTRFRTGSITKMFTALAVMQLVEEGKLSLDDAVHDIAPHVPIENPWRETAPVRVAHLLEHTAGFDDMHFRHMNSDRELPDSLSETVADLGHEFRVRWPPGVMHGYSNPGYALAGYIVERVSGLPFHRYVNERLLAPMELRDARWGAVDEIAQGYTTTRAGLLREVPPRGLLLYPAGELSLSSADAARLLRLLLQRGELDETRIVSSASIARMETPRAARAARHGLDNGYGLGDFVIFREGFRLHGHDGGLDGFIAELAYSPEHGFGYAVFLNRAEPGTLRVLGNLAVEFLATDIAPPSPGALDAPAAKPSEAVEGCYRKRNARNEILRGVEWLLQVTCARVDEGRVLLRHPVLPDLATFVPAHDQSFRAINDAWPTLVFMQDAGMPDALEWSGSYFERSTRAAVTLPLALAGVSLLLMLSALAYFPVWLLRWKFGPLTRGQGLSMRAWPLAASVLFLATVTWSLRLELSLLDTINTVTLGILAGGVAFALASFIALHRVWRTWNGRVHPAVRWHSLLVALACVCVALYLMAWKLVPLRLWAW